WFEIAFLAFGSLLGYTGFLVGINKGKGHSLGGLIGSMHSSGEEDYLKILDTSVIIDGRIADICETGFIDGVFIVPHFILIELQHIADSPDSMKRARGRRGLDILDRMQKMPQINVRIVEDDFPKIREVDSKLVALGKRMDAKVVTNDFNLNKVSELQGVQVLNINELANAIKPLVLPGEPLRVFVIKEGKEQNQGVAYLEDGTMVVVDNGRKMIGKNIKVIVTSVLQTTAGRMIFTKRG
ncbi:PIN/TRAM domain-containing protein, partial [Nitrospirota bacterium]